MKARLRLITLFAVLPVVVLPPAGLAHSGESEDVELGLLNLKRVYVDRFGGGESASQLRDMIIASLQRAKLFVVTESVDRADAVLRGSAEDLVFTDVFQTSEGVTARTGIAAGSGSASSRGGRNSGALHASIGENESARIQERKHEASASVRLVNRDGDVIWSTTQESLGAKFRSASADVADKITRQLVQDVEKTRARKAPGASSREDSPAPATSPASLKQP